MCCHACINEISTIRLAPPKSDDEYKETTDNEQVDVGKKFIEVVNELSDNNQKIRPKILFTPNNTLTWKIIKRVSCKIGEHCSKFLCKIFGFEKFVYNTFDSPKSNHSLSDTILMYTVTV